MKCPICDVEAMIGRSYTSVEGDNSPDTETRVFTVQEFWCRNKQCENYGRPIGIKKHQLNIQ